MPDFELKPDVPCGPLNRRRFLKGAAASFMLFLSRSAGAASVPDMKRTTDSGAGHLIQGKLAFFTPYQAALIEEVASLIIPSDESPGAKEAGVVFEIDRMTADSKEDQRIYADGIEWLDYMAENIAGKNSFLDLSHDDKIKILRIADSGQLPFTGKVLLFIQYRGTRIARSFFAMIRQHTIEIFYTNGTGWRMLGYEGPPQWSGYRDYYGCL